MNAGSLCIGTESLTLLIAVQQHLKCLSRHQVNYACSTCFSQGSCHNQHCMLITAETLDILPWRCSGSLTRQTQRLCYEAFCTTGAPLGIDSAQGSILVAQVQIPVTPKGKSHRSRSTLLLAY